MGNVAVLYWNMDPKDMENIIRQKCWIWLYMEHRFEVLDSQFYLFNYCNGDSYVSTTPVVMVSAFIAGTLIVTDIIGHFIRYICSAAC